MLSLMETNYIEIIGIDDIYNIIVHKFFIWNIYYMSKFI